MMTMEIIIIDSIVILICLLVTAHFSQRTAQEAKKLNEKMDRLIKVLQDR
jgi:hypothetical protein